MTPDTALDLFRQALLTALLLASPMLATGLVIGLIVSVFQAVTSIQEMTLTFVPKIIVVFLVLLAMAPWMMEIMIKYTSGIFTNIPNYIR